MLLAPVRRRHVHNLFFQGTEGKCTVVEIMGQSVDSVQKMLLETVYCYHLGVGLEEVGMFFPFPISILAQCCFQHLFTM